MHRAALALTLVIAAGIAWGTLKPPGPPGPEWYLTDKQMHAGAFALLMLPFAFAQPRLALRLADAVEPTLRGAFLLLFLLMPCS